MGWVETPAMASRSSSFSGLDLYSWAELNPTQVPYFFNPVPGLYNSTFSLSLSMAGASSSATFHH